MTNKTEALARLTQLEADAAALRKVLEAPDPAPSLLPASLESGWRIDGSSGDFNNSRIDWKAAGENYFATQQQAQDYADAFSTLILLRRQPGTEKSKDNETQFVIQVSEHEGVKAISLDLNENKVAMISPCFATFDDAKQAIKSVGPDRIRKMMLTFHHME